MRWIDRLVRSLRGKKLERELEEEFAFHLEMRTREQIEPAEAVRRFGNSGRIKEACREIDTLAWIGSVRQDLAYAWRTLKRSPLSAVAAIACMALGIGANTAVFSYVNAFLFRPLAIERPEQFVMLERPGAGPVSYPSYLEWKRLNTAFSGLIAFTPERLTLGRGTASEQLLGEIVSPDYFEVLGVRPTLGRTFRPDEERQPVAVISQALYKRLFSGPDATGRAIWINRHAYTVIGVAPDSFTGLFAPWRTDAWVTLGLHAEMLQDPNAGWLMLAGRLLPGMEPRQAAEAMNALDATLRRQHPDAQGRVVAKLVVHHRILDLPPVAAASALLMAIVGLVFLMACANVANLLLARAATRRREITIRLSLGTGPWRILRQLLTESGLLGLVGMAAGALLAYASGDVIGSLIPDSITGGFRVEHGLDGRVLAFTLALAGLSVLLVGLAPAWQASRQNLVTGLKNPSAGGGRRPRMRSLLVVAQVALAVVVLVAAGLFLRSFERALEADPGYDTSRVLTAYLDLREMRYSPPHRVEFYRRAVERVSRLPGVVSVSLTNAFPFGDSRMTTLIREDAPPIEVGSSTVDLHYFATMGIPILRGHDFAEHVPDQVIVNEALARSLWGAENPVGRQIRLRRGGPLQQVVGVARNGKYESLQEPSRPFLYRLAEQPAETPLYLVVRSTATVPESLSESVRHEIQQLDGDLPLIRVTPGKLWLADRLSPVRTSAVLLGVFGMIALSLAAIGIYGLIAHLVTERTSEIAIRMALGARSSVVLWMILRYSAALMAVGLALGSVAALAGTRLLAAFRFQVSPRDAATFAGVCGLLAVVGLVAAFVPARRAVGIDPIAALRTE